MPPYGGTDSTEYASALWQALVTENLVGTAADNGKLSQGTYPHEGIKETIRKTLPMSEHNGEVIFMRLYKGEDVSVDSVAQDRAKFFHQVVLMYKREAGYDEENKNWFWAVYDNDGLLVKDTDSQSQAGRVAKGKAHGCISCHSAAPGGDYVFND